MKEKHLVRKLALSTLVSRDLGGESEILDPDGLKNIPPYIIGEADKLLANLQNVKGKVDYLISANLRGRRISFLGSIERAALRIATYELLFSSDVPSKVSISEAVILTKKFAGEGPAKYVNGVLRGIFNAISTNNKGQD